MDDHRPALMLAFSDVIFDNFVRKFNFGDDLFSRKSDTV
ncbi:hypothetical protein [Vibrio phage J14]|nr:hypothetical protein [Vibrio phage J14]